MRRFAECLLAALASAQLVTGAFAQTCFTMQAELMHLQGQGVGGSGDRARYERAYREQANVLSRTEMRAREAGCFGAVFFLFRRSVDPSCNMLVGKIRDMQDNLARLEHLRRSGGRDNAYRIRELHGMMNARGCDLPGGNVFTTSPGDNWIFEEDAPYYMGGGTYRTLCVRTCDGYYFPISFSTTSENFPQDAHACDATCPGAEALLFYHPNPGGGPETMMSITGQAYSSLPTAFQYRTSLNPACTCKPPGGYAVVASLQQPSPQAFVNDPAAPPPRPRPAPGEDPETLADRAGYFVPRVVIEDPDGGPPLASGPDGRPVRVVGPALGNAAQDALVITTVPN